MPGRLISDVYFRLPVTLSRASTRGIFFPTTRNSVMRTSPLSWSRSRHLTGCQDRLDDGDITGAATKIARHLLPDLVLSGVRIFFEKRHSRKDHTRRAIAAGDSEMINERLLYRVQPPVLGQALDRGDFLVLDLSSQNQT